MQKISTFSEWLREKEFEELFYKETDDSLNLDESYETHDKNKFNMYSNSMDLYSSVITLNEAIILPEKIKINTYDSEKLNELFKKQNIIFFNVEKTQLWARYNPNTDETEVYYSDKNKFNEIEAIIGHEMIHKAQNKLNVKFIEQAETLVNRINDRQVIMRELMNTNTVESMKSWQKLYKLNEKERNEFLKNSVFEKMAYAYSEVKMNKHLTLSALLEKFNKSGFIIDNKLKKYIGMYWLIKDKI